MIAYSYNPVVRIFIDRDLTLASRARYKDDSIIATFDDPITLYRVLDGEELARIHDTGIIEGGMFAVTSERAYGASWSATLEKLPEWGISWSGGKARFARLGRDLFIAKIQGQGLLFYHQGPQNVPFDPAGSLWQPSQMDASECHTGLGCSLRVGAWVAEYSRVTSSGQLDAHGRLEIRLKPLTQDDVRTYIARKPLPDVALRSLGGPQAYGGTILGVTVLVYQDHKDKLWGVATRDEKQFVMGGKTKKQAIDAALVILSYGVPHHRGYVTYLNRRPEGIDEVAEGQMWQHRRYSKQVKVDEVGASYVDVTWIDPYETYPHRSVIEAKRFLREFILV
jgi:hypothetical protein